VHDKCKFLSIQNFSLFWKSANELVMIVRSYCTLALNMLVFIQRLFMLKKIVLKSKFSEYNAKLVLESVGNNNHIHFEKKIKSII